MTEYITNKVSALRIHIMKIKIPKAGLKAFTFTFG